MCIAIVKPKGCKLPKREWLENSFESNPDGGGFAVLKPNQNEIGYMKGYFNFEEYYKVLKDSIKTEDVALIPLRITTNGGNDNITEATYNSFNDVIYATTGLSFSLNASGHLIATIS